MFVVTILGVVYFRRAADEHIVVFDLHICFLLPPPPPRFFFFFLGGGGGEGGSVLTNIPNK